MSAEGNLFASTLILSREGDPPAPQLAFVASLALDRALAAWVDPARLRIKWPNDLLLDGAKVSGILLEGEGRAIVIGFGVNLAGHPDELDPPVTSLAAAGILPPYPQQLCLALAEAFARGLADWRAAGFEAIRAAWSSRAVPGGARLVARLADGQELVGVNDGLDADGALRLRLASGEVRAIHAGDVFTL